jgi:hypothetical protein
MGDPAPLRRLHSDDAIEKGPYRFNLAFWRAQSTEEIIASLKRQPGDSTYQEYLKVKTDGTVMQGNTRIKVLEERGYNVNVLPRYPAN